MFSATCELETLSFCARQHSGYSLPSAPGTGICGVGAFVGMRENSGPTGLWGKCLGWSPCLGPCPSPHHRPQVPCRLSVLHRPRPDVPSWGGTRGSGQGRWLFLSADGLGRSRLSSTRPDPGQVFRVSLPQGLPSFILRDTGHGEGSCRLLGLALPEWLETALLCPQDPKGQSAAHGCMASPQPRLENGSPARQTSSRSCALVWFFRVANVGFVLMLDGSARSPEPSAP